MEPPSRRQYLRVLGSVAVLSLVGCVSDDDPEFLVTDTALSVLESTDLNVQITVENSFPDRRQATLEVVVRYGPADGSTEEWRQTEPLVLSGGTEIQRSFRFEDVHESGADLENYEIEARLLDTDESE